MNYLQIAAKRFIISEQVLASNVLISLRSIEMPCYTSDRLSVGSTIHFLLERRTIMIGTTEVLILYAMWFPLAWGLAILLLKKNS